MTGLDRVGQRCRRDDSSPAHRTTRVLQRNRSYEELGEKDSALCGAVRLYDNYDGWFRFGGPGVLGLAPTSSSTAALIPTREAHLRGCDGCEGYLQQFRSTIDTLGHIESNSLDPVFRDRLLAALRE
jgi:hypothetical protein